MAGTGQKASERSGANILTETSSGFYRLAPKSSNWKDSPQAFSDDFDSFGVAVCQIKTVERRFIEGTYFLQEPGPVFPAFTLGGTLN